MAINVSVQHNGGFLPGITLLTQCYHHRGTRLNVMVRFVSAAYDPRSDFYLNAGKPRITTRVRCEQLTVDVSYCCILLLLCCTVLYCTVLYCTVLYCTVLYCIILSSIKYVP